jgi:hypothetical protein
VTLWEAIPSSIIRLDNTGPTWESKPVNQIKSFLFPSNPNLHKTRTRHSNAKPCSLAFVLTQSIQLWFPIGGEQEHMLQPSFNSLDCRVDITLKAHAPSKAFICETALLKQHLHRWNMSVLLSCGHLPQVRPSSEG